MNPVLESLQDASGGTSSNRVAFLLVVLGILLVWGAVAIMGALTAYNIKVVYALPDIPWGVVTFALGGWGLKTYQRKLEDVPAPTATAGN